MKSAIRMEKERRERTREVGKILFALLFPEERQGALGKKHLAALAKQDLFPSPLNFFSPRTVVGCCRQPVGAVVGGPWAGGG